MTHNFLAAHMAFNEAETAMISKMNKLDSALLRSLKQLKEQKKQLPDKTTDLSHDKKIKEDLNSVSPSLNPLLKGIFN